MAEGLTLNPKGEFAAVDDSNGVPDVEHVPEVEEYNATV